MNKMIFLNVGWMKHYQGLEGDSIAGGGSYVEQHNDGCEIKNFQPYEGYMYGFARILVPFDQSFDKLCSCRRLRTT